MSTPAHTAIPGPLTPEQLTHYHDHGYIVLRSVVEPELLARVKAAVSGMLDGSVPTEGFFAGIASKMTEDDPGRFIQQVAVRTWPPANPAIRDLWGHPGLTAIMRQVLQADRVRIFQWQMLQKGGGGANATPWHQDEHYWRWGERQGVDAATCWLPLVPTDRHTGTMWLLPDSHHGGVMPHAKTVGVSMFHTITEPIDESRLIPLELAVGDLSIHHKCLVHGAYPNTSTRTRIAVAQHYRALRPDEPPGLGMDGH